ncbi:class F sortase [Streptomyces phaeochromogenes]|uniref:class F sortase n=1 Tax=Streptomyces phaeochromogenes TaxID=1923 RepID=UPI0033C97D19
MTLPSRRALSRRGFVTAAVASLLVSCGGSQTDRSTDDRTTDDRAGAEKTGNSQSPAKAAKALGRSVPVRLQVPAIQVDTPLMRLGLTSDGTVEVPPIAADDKAGWYEHSPTPGQVGPSVILGHVTVGSYGDGVFHHLSRLRRGDRIVARLENGKAAEFAVTDVRTVAQAQFPTDDVYGDVGRPELRLITCGGPRTGDGYRDSVIVFAALTADSTQ